MLLGTQVQRQGRLAVGMTNRLTRGQRNAWRVKRVAQVVVPLMWLVFVSSCSGGVHVSARPRARSGYFSRRALDGRVSLTPSLLGGTAGWCMTLFSRGHKRGGRSSGDGCEEVPVTSAGPVFAQTCTTSRALTTAYLLTRSDVAAVVVDGGSAVPTTGGASLAEGLRSAVVEVLGPGPVSPFQKRLAISKHLCSAVTALNNVGQPIRQAVGHGKPLMVNLPSKRWEPPALAPHGVCGFRAERLPAETIALEGSVETEIRAIQGLIGEAFLSCADTTYLYQKEHDLTAAVLLDASHPGVTPPLLVDMKPLQGHSGIFEAPGSNGVIVARRIPGAWLVVEEEEEVGRRVPLELLEHLRATVDL